MVDPRWRKVLADLGGNKIRTFLVMLTIAVGVFAVGFVSSSFIILLDDMDTAYQSINPSGATIYCAPFDDDLLHTMRKVPGVAQVEGRSTFGARVSVNPDKKVLVDIVAIPPMEDVQIDRIRANDAGSALTLGDREVFIERSALSVLQVKPGDVVKFEFAEGYVRELSVAGVVHDITFPSYVFANQIRAFVTPETMEWLGGSRKYTRMLVTVSERRKDEAHVRAVAQEVAKKIEKSGREVYITIVYQPGRHWASDITQALGVLMGGLGALAVFLSAFLVINTITALLAQQTQQIGIMKAVGGRTLQIVSLYIGLVLSFGLLALAVAVPLSALIGYSVAEGVSGLLNFNLAGFRIPPASIIMQTGVALVVPVGAALVPVLNGTRITVNEAISSYGLGKGKFGRSLIDRAVEKIRFLSRPLLISLRNTIRRKGRLALTLSTLTLGGAIFIAVFNLRASFDVVLAETLGYILSDVNVSLDRAYRIEKLEPLVMSEPGVTKVEGWGFSTGQVLSGDKSTGVEILFIAPPADSTLIKPVMTAGRWLLPEDENAMVIGNHLVKERPDLKVGDEVVTKIEGKEYAWKIVGIYKLVGNVVPPIVYANYEYLARIRGEVDRFSSLRIVTTPQDDETQKQVAKSLESKFRQAGITVYQMETGTEISAQQAATTDVLVNFLLVMAVLIAVVGGLGLMGTMSMNVLERTREIGVMRAIGASDGAIMRIVIVEGLLIGTISWALGAVLSVPISALLGYTLGVAMLNAPMDFVFSFGGFLVWLGGVLVISALASLLPARNATRLTIREVLAYE